MKLSSLKQQIEELDAKAKAAPSQVEFYDAIYERDRLMAENAPELLRRLLVAEEALQRLGDCDWVITLPDRMDGVRAIAREALATISRNGDLGTGFFEQLVNTTRTV